MLQPESDVGANSVEYKETDSLLDTTHDQVQLDKVNEQYQRTLTRSLWKCRTVILLTMAEPFLSSSVYPILVLYIQSFSATSVSAVSYLMLIGMIYYAFSTLIYTSLSDKYGHDRFFILSFLIVGVALLLQSIATNMYVYTLGFFLNKVPTLSVGFAYIPSILPHKYAVRYTSYLWTICSVVYLLGPIVGATVAKYTSYRGVYVMDTVYHFVCFGLSWFLLSGSVASLRSEQSAVGILEHLKEDEQFPFCVITQRDQHAQPILNDAVNEQEEEEVENESFVRWMTSSAQRWRIEYIAFWTEMSVADSASLMASIIMNNGTWAVEAIVIFYYVLFMTSRYDADIVYCTAMLFSMVLSFGIMNLLMPRLIRKVIPTRIWLIVLSSFLMIAVGVVAGLDDAYKVEYYWLFSIALGVVLGMTSILSEMCILELQPKQHVGKVTGMRDCIKYLFRGAGIVLVGVFWSSPSYNALWFGVAVSGMICCTVCVCLWLVVAIGVTRKVDPRK